MRKKIPPKSDKIKKQIFFARTYRRLRSERKSQTIYILLLLVPCILAMLFFYSEISRFISEITAGLLQSSLGLKTMPLIAQSEFLPFFGPVFFVKVATPVPSTLFILLNLLFVLVALLFFTTGNNRGMPLSIFIVMSLIIQFFSCIFFLFASSYFPYSNSIYSELYMEQQVGIWLCFIIIAGAITGLISNGRFYKKILTFVTILLYSFVFGSLRYLVFLFVVSRFSALYMGAMFFVLGPFFDFLYLVFIYSVFVDKMITSFENRNKGDIWLWT